MRFLPISLVLAAALTVLSSAGLGQRADDAIDARSTLLVQKAEAARVAGNLVAANDALETALAVDPRNRMAYLALGRVARAQNLPGKAIRYYKDALALEPTDQVALAGEGEAMVQKGAVESAKANLARLQQLCKGACAPATELSAAIAKGPPAAVVTAQATTVVPPKGQEAKTTKPE